MFSPKRPIDWTEPRRNGTGRTRKLTERQHARFAESERLATYSEMRTLGFRADRGGGAGAREGYRIS